MVIAHHLILTAYGFWLPNDPRGSWSTWIREWELLRYGDATKVNTRKSVAHAKHDKNKRQQAKKVLRFPEVHFSGVQARSVANGFAKAADESGCVIHACSILPDHVHLVVRRHAHKAEMMVGHFKGRASQQLRVDGLHPFESYPDDDGSLPSPWAEGPWKVFIDNVAHLLEAIRYVENNPIREGLRPQRWNMITPFVR